MTSSLTSQHLADRPLDPVVLLPCPFCGGPAKHKRECKEHIVFCVSYDCLVEPCTKSYPEEQMAVDAWNNRKQNPKVQIGGTL